MKMLIKEFFRWCYWYPFRIIVHQVPVPAAYKMVDYFKPLLYRVQKRKRSAIARGLARMYENKEQGKEIGGFTLKTIDNLLKTSIDVILYPKFNKEYCDKYIEYKGLGNLDEALKKGKGVVLLHGHFGNPHMIMPAIGYKGYKLNQLASRTPPEKRGGILNGWIFNIKKRCYEIKLRFKESLPVNFVYIDDFMRAPFDILKRNEVLAVGIDGREGVKSVDLNFLNHRAVFYTGSMRLIMKAKPVVLPTFHLRNDDNTHTMIIEKPMELIDTGRRDEDIYDNMSKFINILEEKVYQYPWLYADAFCISDTFLIPPQNDSS